LSGLGHRVPGVVRSGRSVGILTIAALAAFCYVVLLGGTAEGEVQPLLRLANAGLAAALILYYVLKAPGRADRMDLGILAGLVLFSAAALLSVFPRQSFDALLAVTTYAAALFVARELMARATARVAFIRVLMALSALLALITVDRWFPAFLEWWSIAGWSVLPPLDLNLAAAPWGHRHDLALLSAMLYPSWWIGRGSPLQRACAVVIGGLTLALVVIDGSRMLWLALVVATAFLVVPRIVRRWEPNRDLRLLLVGGTLAAAVLFTTGAGAALLDRLSSLSSLAWRGAMWGPLTEAWLSHPLAGLGPGSFPWVLQLTDYFNTSSYAPRHPDSVLFQLLAEGGLLGLAALSVVVASLVPAILGGRSLAARWALIGFAVAGFGSNPTDFAFLLAVAIAWAAYAVPHEQIEGQEHSWNRVTLTAALGSLGVAGVAYSLTLAASFAYEQARTAIEAGRLAPALTPLDVAVTLDPEMALYSRQRGTLHYLLKDEISAIRDLTHATELNPSDDLAWRTLGLAAAAGGNQAAAESAIRRALAAQRSDPTNLLLLADWQTDTGRGADALATLGEVVQSWPWTIGAPGWGNVIRPSTTTQQVIEEAIARWQRMDPSPEPFSGQGIWLATLGGRPDLIEGAIEQSGTSRSLAQATIAVFRCDSNAARLLERLPASERRTYLYWLLRLRESAMRGSLDAGALRIVEITGGASLSFDEAQARLNPLNENGAPGFSADAWGYRRPPINWPADVIALPSPGAGAARWLLDPLGAMQEADVEGRLPHCG
jgi:tetratricopeptide (TPR) repeat protein